MGEIGENLDKDWSTRERKYERGIIVGDREGGRERGKGREREEKRERREEKKEGERERLKKHGVKYERERNQWRSGN